VVWDGDERAVQDRHLAGGHHGRTSHEGGVVKGLRRMARGEKQIAGAVHHEDRLHRAPAAVAVAVAAAVAAAAAAAAAEGTGAEGAGAVRGENQPVAWHLES
jgi:hypothetical protein